MPLDALLNPEAATPAELAGYGPIPAGSGGVIYDGSHGRPHTVTITTPTGHTTPAPHPNRPKWRLAFVVTLLRVTRAGRVVFRCP